MKQYYASVDVLKTYSHVFKIPDDFSDEDAINYAAANIQDIVDDSNIRYSNIAINEDSSHFIKTIDD